MNRMEDATLLRNYANTGSDQAFNQLVSRHFDLVYCSALRVVGGDAHLAQDVAQRVFTDLARKAGRLPQGLFLGGWLYKHACFTAANAVRTERRRENRERQAAEMTKDSSDSETVWRQLAPVLDEAMRELKTADRDAIVMRFFDRQPFRVVGEALGTSEEGARKRVERALEKMRSFFVGRGLSVSSMVLANVMETHAAGAAPAGLSGVVAASALAAAKSSGTGLFFLKLTTVTKTQIATAALLAGLAATIMVQSRATARLRDENRALLGQAAQLDGLRAENQRLRSQPVPAAAALSQDQVLELARSRAEIGRLHDQLEAAQKAAAQNAAASQSAAARGRAASPGEAANVYLNLTMPVNQTLSVLAQVANEKIVVPAHFLDSGLVRLITTNHLTRTEAINFMAAALMEQAQFTVTRSADGTLVGTPKEQLRGPPEFMAETRTYLPDGHADPPLLPPGRVGSPPPRGSRQLPVLANPPQ
jgi:RNA polymerase sigma factor (sigma-70 family)